MINWPIWVAGILSCAAGVYLFARNAFEEDRSIRPAILLMITGVVLIAYATAIAYRLI